VGASLSPQEIERFDAKLDRLLAAIAPERFVIPHLITLHMFEPRG
jgi:hypothetical protein